MKKIFLPAMVMGIFLVVFFAVTDRCQAAVFQDFNDFPATGTNEIPGSTSNWLYTTDVTNPDNNYSMTTYQGAGWRNTDGYPGSPTTHSFFKLYINSYNSAHMGFETYGYFDIDNQNAVSGNSLRYVITGGKNEDSCGVDGSGNKLTEAACVNSFGLRVGNKEQYLNYLSLGQDPVEHEHIVGSPYVYFMNTSFNVANLPFPEAQGANRLSFYAYIPSFVTNGTGGIGNPPALTFDVGPFNGTGGHWYNRFTTQGGGWTHYLVDAHPQHNNAWDNASKYPYPSYSMRSMGTDFFNTLHTWYFATSPYTPGWGGVPPYSVWFDEIEFVNDVEPQNEETIANPSVLYKPETKIFEIGFNDKYKSNQYSYSTYEMRYSFSPITNVNWSSATPVAVQADNRFRIGARADGKFAKWWPYYQSVWAPFKLASTSDEDQLTPGTTIYFAIKDISQQNGDGQIPVTGCGVGNWNMCGRDYANHGVTFDYAGDQPALSLIKRINYRVAGGAQDTTAPVAPSGLSVE